MRRETQSAIAKYKRHAAGYDATTGRTGEIRRQTIALLRLREGDTVLDVGCGTGLSFPLLEEAIGARGRIIGIEQSPDMLALARSRVAAGNWANITLIESPAEDAVIAQPVDALLFHFAHDVLRSKPALDRLLGSARPNATVAVAGMKYLPWWLAPANLIIRARARPYVTTLEGFDKPWSLLAARLSEFDVASALFGSCYIGRGVYTGANPV